MSIQNPSTHDRNFYALTIQRQAGSTAADTVGAVSAVRDALVGYQLIAAVVAKPEPRLCAGAFGSAQFVSPVILTPTMCASACTSCSGGLNAGIEGARGGGACSIPN